VFHASDLSRGRSPGIFSGLVGKHREQTSIAWIKIEVVFVGFTEIGLLKNERHSQQSLPEFHGTLLGRTNNGNVMKPLNL
jgi:hypothetical protein